jgi:hypothetical protein
MTPNRRRLAGGITAAALALAGCSPGPAHLPVAGSQRGSGMPPLGSDRASGLRTARPVPEPATTTHIVLHESAHTGR